jgi:TATA-box binding protein (TBP) (component of TFIID and TFIIIB)
MDFKKLEITTHTIMVYVNCMFDMEKIKAGLKINTTTDLKMVSDKIHGELYTDNSATSGNASRFRNQIPVRIFVINKTVAIKIFKTGKLHITGCKTMEHAYQASVELMKKFKNIGAIIDCENTDLEITFETVMANIGFELDFIINREKLDNLIQKSGFNDMYSIFEPITQTSVNVKMRYADPENKFYNQVVLKPDNSYTLIQVPECPKAKIRPEREHTFLVFGGSNKGKVKHKSKVIQSGRYYDTHMEPAFKNFLDFVHKNKDLIEMKKEESSFNINDLIGI